MILLFSSCKKDDEITIKDPDQPSEPSDQPGGEIAAEKKVEIFGKVNQFVEELNWDDRNAAQLSIVAFLNSLPEIKEAGLSEAGDNVWGEFTDGTLYLVLNNRPSGSEIPDPDYSNMRRIESTQRTNFYNLPTLPESKKVYIFSGVGNYFKSTRSGNDFLKFLFQKDKEKTGYEVQIIDATLKNLKEVKDAGVFYFSSHGGFVKLNEKDSIYGVFTSDNVDVATEKAYKADVKKKDLVYITAYNRIENGKKVAETHWGITANFVKKNMKFPKYSMMYLDICQSFVVKDFWWAFHSKSDATGTVLGWTDKVDDQDAYATAAYYFDRLVAANTIYEVTKPEDPKQRSFSLPAIFSDMAKKDLGKSIPYKEQPDRVSYLSYHSAPNIDILLRPTISYMMVHEYFDWLLIWGEFGEDPGEGQRLVTVNGMEVEVVEWDPVLVKCKIPPSGKGSAGDVIVKVRGNQSHPRTLTEWRGTLKYKRPSAGSIVEEATINLHIRRDVALYRKAPGEDPVKVPLSVFPYPAADSKGSYKLGGNAKHVESSGCTYTYYARWTAREGSLALFRPEMGENESFSVQVMETENGFTMKELALIAIKPHTNTMKTDHVCPSSSGTTGDEDFKWTMADIPAKFRSFTLQFDNNFNIKGGRLTDKGEDRSGISYGGENAPEFNITLEWEAMKPNFPPKADAAL